MIRDQDVLWLEVSVDHSRCMKGGDAMEQPLDEPETTPKTEAMGFSIAIQIAIRTVGRHELRPSLTDYIRLKYLDDRV